MELTPLFLAGLDGDFKTWEALQVLQRIGVLRVFPRPGDENALKENARPKEPFRHATETLRVTKHEKVDIEKENEHECNTKGR